MPTQNGTSIYLPKEHGDRLRDIATRENRQIVDTVARMLDYYEPLTLIDHAIVAKLALELKLTTGQALSHVIQSWQDFVRLESAPQQKPDPGRR